MVEQPKQQEREASSTITVGEQKSERALLFFFHFCSAGFQAEKGATFKEWGFLSQHKQDNPPQASSCLPANPRYFVKLTVATKHPTLLISVALSDNELTLPLIFHVLFSIL